MRTTRLDVYIPHSTVSDTELIEKVNALGAQTVCDLQFAATWIIENRELLSELLYYRLLVKHLGLAFTEASNE